MSSSSDISGVPKTTKGGCRCAKNSKRKMICGGGCINRKRTKRTKKLNRSKKNKNRAKKQYSKNKRIKLK
jgi:hypothetical protein